MKIRQGFVSNSSSSSFVVHTFFKYEEPEKKDQKLIEQYIGKNITGFRVPKEWYNDKKEHPLDIPSVANEIRRALDNSSSVTSTHPDYLRLMIYTYNSFQSNKNHYLCELELWTEHLEKKNYLNLPDPEKDLLFLHDTIQRYQYKYDISCLNFNDFEKKFHEDIPLENLRFLYTTKKNGRYLTTIGYNENEKIDVSKIPYQKLLKQKIIREKDWCYASDQQSVHEELDWTDEYIIEMYKNLKGSEHDLQRAKIKMECLEDIEINKKQIANHLKSIEILRKSKTLLNMKWGLLLNNEILLNDPQLNEIDEKLHDFEWDNDYD